MRPLRQASIDELEQMATCNDVDRILQVREELAHRSTGRARRLLTMMDKVTVEIVGEGAKHASTLPSTPLRPTDDVMPAALDRLQRLFVEARNRYFQERGAYFDICSSRDQEADQVATAEELAALQDRYWSLSERKREDLNQKLKRRADCLSRWNDDPRFLAMRQSFFQAQTQFHAAESEFRCEERSWRRRTAGTRTNNLLSDVDRENELIQALAQRLRDGTSPVRLLDEMLVSHGECARPLVARAMKLAEMASKAR